VSIPIGRIYNLTATEVSPKDEGARIYQASSVEEARHKAAELFYDHSDEYLPWYAEELRFRVKQ